MDENSGWIPKGRGIRGWTGPVFFGSIDVASLPTQDNQGNLRLGADGGYWHWWRGTPRSRNTCSRLAAAGTANHGDGLLEREKKEFFGSIDVASLPRIIRETSGWGADGGYRVFQLYLRGGFEAIDQAFKNPPSSTEQVLHPEKYLAGDEPHSVELPDLASALGSTWELQDEGVLGELLIRIHLGTFLTAGQALAAARGWGGDGYSLLKDDQGRQLMAVGFSWDSTAEAEEFFQAYLGFVERKSQGQLELAETSESSRLWVGDGTSTYLAIDGGTTQLVIGSDLGTVKAVADIISVPTGGS